MSVDATGLATEFSIFDTSVLTEEDKANNRRFPTPKEFVDSASVGGGDINFDELGKAYVRHYKEYATKSVGMPPALADAKAIAIQNMFFNGKDSAQFNDAWSGVINPQQAQAKAQEQAKAAQGDAGHLDNIQRGYFQQSAAGYLSSAFDDMAQAEAATRIRSGQDWLSNRIANDNTAMVMGGGQPIDINNKISGPLPNDPYGAVAQTNEQSAITNVQQAQAQLDKANALPVSKGIEEFSKTEGFWDAAGNLIANPFDTAIPLIEQSLAPMASQLGAAAGGAVVAGIPGAMVAGGAASYEVNRAAKILEEAQKTGRPILDVVRDAQARGDIQGEASRYATVVGAADALSMGAAGATMPARTLLGRAAMQTGLQAGLGGAGEAGGQIAATGEITSGRDIAAEALLEVPFGALETGIARFGRANTQGDRTQPVNRDNRLTTTTVTPEPIQAGVNPLAQFVPPAVTPTQAPTNQQATNQAVRGKSIGDLIASGEGDYQSFNRGKAGDAAGEKIDFSQMTVAEVMQRQALPEGNPNRIFTVGKYQAIPDTFAEAVQKLGIPADTKVTPALQEYIFSEYLLKDKRPDIRDYITGKTDNLRAAQKAGAQEWAAIADPDTGLSAHGGVGNNKASIAADTFGRSLESVRKAYADAVAQGSNPAEAWSRAVSTQSTYSPSTARTSEGFQRTTTEPTVNQSNEAQSSTLSTSSSPVTSPTEPIIKQLPPAEIYDAQNNKYNAQYEVVDAATLNPAIDKADNQYRDRNRAESQRQIESIASDPNYGRLNMLHSTFTDGAPVLQQDSTIIAGNGRIAGLKKAYESGNADNYKRGLISDLSSKGIDVAPIEQMQSPILVRRLTDNVDTKKVSVLSNVGSSMSMSPSEQAIIDAEYIQSLHDFTPDDTGEISFQSASGLFKRLAKAVPANERNSILTDDNKVGADGVRRVKNALLYMAYGDSPALRQMTESGTPDHINVTKALVKAAPVLAELRDNIRQGISHDADITPAIVDSFALFSQIKRDQNNTIESWLNQQDVFSQVKPEVKILIKRLDEATRRPNQLSDFLVNYANKLKTYGSPKQMGLLGANVAPSQLEVLNRAEADRNNATTGGATGGQREPRVSEPTAQLGTENRPESRVAEADTGGYGRSGIVDPLVTDEKVKALPARKTYRDSFPSMVNGKITDPETKTYVDQNAKEIAEVAPDVGRLAQWLLLRAPDDAHAYVARKIVEATARDRVSSYTSQPLGEIPVFIGNVNEGAIGSVYIHGGYTKPGEINSLNIYKNKQGEYASTYHAVMHEMIHVVTLHSLRTPAHKKEAIRLMALARDAGLNEYGTTTVAEFIAEAMSNAAFQQKLAAIKDGNGKASLLDTLIQLVRQVLGIDSQQLTLLDSSNALFESLVLDSSTQRLDFKQSIYPDVVKFVDDMHDNGEMTIGEARAIKKVLADVGITERDIQGRVKDILGRSLNMPAYKKLKDQYFKDGYYKPRQQTLYNISPRPLNFTGNDTPLTTAWKLIAAQDDAFQLPISGKKTLSAIATDYDPAIKVELGPENKTQRQWVIRFPNGKSFQEATVTEGKGRDKTIYLDISQFKTGSGGRTVYQMVGDYAHNTGKVFIGDPNGLSAIAQIRRTENMLSSALRWGTTDHLQPHELQLKPDNPNATPLQWKVGNTEFNIDQMLRASMSNLLNQIPELGQIRYNFESQQFEADDANGKTREYLDTDFETLTNQSRGARAAQAGRTTLKRAVVSASILSGQGQAAWNAILGNLIQQPNQQLGPLTGILYGLNPSFDQTIQQVATDKQLSTLAEDALLSVFGGSPKNQTIATRLLRQFFFDNFVPSDTYPDSRSFVTAQMNELRSSGALQAINDTYFSGNAAFKLKDDANRKPISADKAEAAIRRILGDIPFETRIPDEIKAGAGEAANRVKGAFANGKIYIDTRNIGSIAEAEALAVEELTHRGVANLFGDEYESRLNALYEAVGGEAGIRRFTEQHQIEMAEDYFKQSPTTQIDELLAHIEANQNTLTVRVKRAFQRIIAHLRNAIRALNTRVLHNVSDSDIVLIARNARNAAKESVNNPMANPRFGIRPERESAAITEERMIAEEYSRRTRQPLSDRVKRSIYSGGQTLQEQGSTLRRELFKRDSDWWAAVKQWNKRYFYSDSILGRNIADAQRKVNQENAGEHKLVENDLILLDALIHNIYGKHGSELSTDEQEQFHQAITGQSDVFANPNHQRQLQYFRRRIDNVSQKLINQKYAEMQMRIEELNDEGKAALNGIAADLLAGKDEVAVPPFLAQIAKLQRQINTIEGNKGAYLNRSYRAFTDPKWATTVRKKPVFGKAVTFVVEQRAQQIKEDADAKIAERQESIRRIQSRASKLESLQDELTATNKKRSFRVSKLQNLQQVNARSLNADELATHQRRLATTNKELADLNDEAARLTKRINDITSGNFKLDKAETDQVNRHQQAIQQLQADKLAVDNGTHPELLTRNKAALKLGDWLNGTAGHRSLLDFASGQGTNENILKRRKDIPPVLRELLGEFTDPVYNYANTITQVADYVARHQYQMSLRNFLKSMDGIAFIGAPPEGVEVDRFPDTAAYSVVNDLLVEKQFMAELDDFGVLDSIKDPFYLALTRLATTVKLGKTAVASPTTLARNFIGGGIALAGAGHSPFSGVNGAWKVIRNSRNRKDYLSGNIILSNEEAAALNQKYIRLGVRGDGASSNELARMFSDLQTARDASHAVTERGIGRRFIDWSLDTYAFGDDFFKIICFEKDYADLIKAGMKPAEAEQEAARRTRDAMPTYSMVPRLILMLRRFPLVGSFVSFPWEQLRTTKNNLALIKADFKRGQQTGNSHWKTMAYKRALGQFIANRGVWVIASLSAMALGISGDDEDALDHFASDWRKGILRVFYGADENGAAFVNFTPIVPSEYIWRSLRLGWQKGEEEGVGSGLFHAVKNFAEPFYSWDISFNGIINLSKNQDDNGLPIYGKGNSLSDLIANPLDNENNWGKALDYFAKQFGPGIIQNVNDFNRALSGSVADLSAEDQNWMDRYWNERAASLGGKVSRSGKEFTTMDATAALLGFRTTHQNMIVLGQQAAQQTKNKVAAYSAEFKDAVGVTNPLSPEFLDSRLEQVIADRQRAYEKMQDLIQYYRNHGKSNAQIVDDLYLEDSVTLSKKDLKALVAGKIPPFEVSKEVMSKALISVERIPNPAERLQAKKVLAERYRYVVRRAAEMQRGQ